MKTEEVKQTKHVILDEECREYKEGWNANNCGANYLSNPYGSLAYDGELYRLWQKGFNENQIAWDKGPNNPQPFTNIKESFSITLPDVCQDYLECIGGCVYPKGSCKHCCEPKGTF